MTQLQIGNRTYDRLELELILESESHLNGVVALAQQEIAAKLNIASAAEASCIMQTLSEVDSLIGNLVVPPVGHGFLNPHVVAAYVSTLRLYNEGYLCAPSCSPYPSQTASPFPRPRPTPAPRP